MAVSLWSMFNMSSVLISHCTASWKLNIGMKR